MNPPEAGTPPNSDVEAEAEAAGAVVFCPKPAKLAKGCFCWAGSAALGAPKTGGASERLDEGREISTCGEGAAGWAKKPGPDGLPRPRPPKPNALGFSGAAVAGCAAGAAVRGSCVDEGAGG